MRCARGNGQTRPWATRACCFASRSAFLTQKIRGKRGWAKLDGRYDHMDGMKLKGKKNTALKTADWIIKPVHNRPSYHFCVAV